MNYIITILIDSAYLISAILFIVGLKLMGSPVNARKGNLISALGMFIAVVVTLLSHGLSYQWIIIGILLGSLIGTISAKKVAMTGMPELVAVFNGFGGASSLLVAVVALLAQPNCDSLKLVTLYLSVLIGAVTFTGSIIAYAKLSGKITAKPILFTGQNIVNAIILIILLALGVGFVLHAMLPISLITLLIIIASISLVLGVMFVIPIGGADMPVVISLLNSYSGLAACAAGFAVGNHLLIVSGALVGASGLILTNIMCKAMNRSLSNVLFSGFGAVTKKAGGSEVTGEIKPISVQDAFYIVESARNVAIIPGYGMAVAQAQHVVQELSELLRENGCSVNFAIHPVAGRMPGHMNVLLAEANVPYENLLEMDAINPQMESYDLAIVIGANDVVNPDAEDTEGSPIYGMPIIQVYKAQTVFVLKRSMNVGFAGVDNPLFYKENTRMLFGDAKDSIQALVSELKG